MWKLNKHFGKSTMFNSETQNIHFLHWIHKTLEWMYIFCSLVNIGTICTPLHPLTDAVNDNNCSNKMMLLVKMPRLRDSRWCSLTPHDLQNILDANSTLPSVAKSNFNIGFLVFELLVTFHWLLLCNLCASSARIGSDPIPAICTVLAEPVQIS